MNESQREGFGMRKRALLHVLLCIAMAAVLRVMAAWLRKGYLGFDESMYIVLGKNLFSGGGLRLNGLPCATFGFGMPFLAGAFLELTGSARWAVSLPTVIFGALGVVPVFLIGRRIWGSMVGFTGALLYAGFPALVFLSPFSGYAERLYAGSEAIFIFFVLSGACVVLAALERPSVGLGMAAGFFFGVGFQIRQDALGYFAAFAAAFYVYRAARSRRVLSEGLVRTAVAAAVVFAILAAPYLLWVRHVTGKTSLGPRFAKTFRMRASLEEVVTTDRWGNALAEYFGLNEDGSQLEAAYYGVGDYHRQGFAEGKYALSPGEVVRGLDVSQAARAWKQLWRQLMPPAAWVLVLVGLASTVYERRWAALVFLVGLLLPTAFVATALYVLGRFYLPLAVGMLLFGARGVDLCARGTLAFLPERMRSGRVGASVYLAIPLAIVLWGVTPTIQRQRRLANDFTKFGRLQVAELDAFLPALAEAVAPGARVVAFSPVIEAIGHVEWLALPQAEPARILDYCRKRRARYLVLREVDGYWAGYKVDDFFDLDGHGRAVLDGQFNHRRWVVFDLGAEPRGFQ